MRFVHCKAEKRGARKERNEGGGVGVPSIGI
jgi:hypothetical protein